jgi:L-alanine-DL-glutamate epimerase-like enolase superfamily enzyme
MKDYVDRGFPAVKMKVGGVAQAEDVARVRAVRTAVGPDTGLIIDGVYSFDPAGAAQLFEQVAPLGIDAFQSPVPADDLDGMRALRRQGVPVMGVEAEYRDEMLSELIEGGAVAVLQLAPIACGGPSRIAALIGRLRAAGIGLTLETSSTAVATMAAAQIAAAWPEVRNIEVHQLHQLFFDQIPLGQARIVSPWPLPDTPGLGVTLRPERIEPGFTFDHPVRPHGRGPGRTAPDAGHTKERPPQSAAS